MINKILIVFLFIAWLSDAMAQKNKNIHFGNYHIINDTVIIYKEKPLKLHANYLGQNTLIKDGKGIFSRFIENDTLKLYQIVASSRKNGIDTSYGITLYDNFLDLGILVNNQHIRELMFKDNRIIAKNPADGYVYFCLQDTLVFFPDCNTEFGKKVTLKTLLNLKPSNEPRNRQEGDVYYDKDLHKLRCFDGEKWQDLW